MQSPQKKKCFLVDICSFSAPPSDLRNSSAWSSTARRCWQGRYDSLRVSGGSLGGSINGGVAPIAQQLDGLFHGKWIYKWMMIWGYPHFGKLPFDIEGRWESRILTLVLGDKGSHDSVWHWDYHLLGSRTAAILSHLGTPGIATIPGDRWASAKVILFHSSSKQW